jgi:hypothetical protein
MVLMELTVPMVRMVLMVLMVLMAQLVRKDLLASTELTV